MHLFKEHASCKPIPEVYRSSFDYMNGVVDSRELYMALVPGRTLKTTWAELYDKSKERICPSIWDLVTQIRTIPRPTHLATDIYCTANSSPSGDPLTGSNNDVPPCVLDDKTLRDRIYTRRVAHNGIPYGDSTNLPDLLPHSHVSVFTHGDIDARNIMVDANGRILGLLDRESSGWFSG